MRFPVSNLWPFLPILMGLCVGCDGVRTNRFAATPVSRSVEPQREENPGFPLFSSPPQRPEFGDPLLQRCGAELKRQSSYPFDFRLRTLDGRTMSKGQFAGRLLVVDIWATWCGPCVREVPHFVDLQHRYRDKGLSMVGINFERGASDQEDRRSVDSFARDAGINYPLALGNSRITDQIPEFRGYPTTLFLDGDGNVRLTLRGSRSLDELETFVKLLLADPSIDPARATYRPNESPSQPAKVRTNPYTL